MATPHVVAVPDRRTWLTALALAVGAVLTYAVWLGWDQQYQRDPVTGQPSGPYESWQVVGCVTTLAVMALLAGAAARRGLAVVVLPLAFTLAWSIPAARSDETGLWLVGAVGILVGTLTGTAALASTSAAVRQRVGHRRPKRAQP